MSEFPALEAAAEASAIWRATTRASARVDAALASSTTVRLLKTGLTAFAALPASERFRLGAMTFGWAAIAYWAALAVMPAYTATGLPRGTFLTLGVVAWLVAGNAVAVTRAWPASRIAGAMRWLIS